MIAAQVETDVEADDEADSGNQVDFFRSFRCIM